MLGAIQWVQFSGCNLVDAIVYRCNLVLSPIKWVQLCVRCVCVKYRKVQYGGVQLKEGGIWKGAI